MARPVRVIVVLAAMVTVTTVPGPVWAQSAGWYLLPTFSIGERYDDNIFGVNEEQAKTSDFITLFTASLQAGYRSEPLTLLASYSVTAEVYADNSDLSNFGGNQSAGLLLAYKPSARPRWTLDFSAGWQRLDSPSQLFLQTPGPAPAGGIPAGAPPPATTDGAAAGATPAAGQQNVPQPAIPAVDVGLADTTVITVNPIIGYQINPRTTATVAYLYTRSDVENEATTGHEARVSLGRQLTLRDEVSLNYLFRYFVQPDEPAGGSTETSQAITLGWTRQLTPATTFRVSAGPSFSDDGGVGADVQVGLDYLFPRGTASISYEHTQMVVVGVSGAADVDSVVVNLTFQPCRLCSAWFYGTFGNIVPVDASEGLGDRVYTAAANFSYQLTRWLSARVSYTFIYQDVIEENQPSVRDNVFSVHLDFSNPFRVY